MAEIGLIDKNEWEKNNEVFVPRFLERTQTKTYLNKQKGGKKGANNRWSGKGTANDSDNGTANGKANGRPNGTPSGTANADKDKDKDKDEDKDIDKEEDIKQVKSYNDFSELDRKNKMGWVINKLPDGFFDEPWALVGKWLNDFKHKTVYLGIKSINSKNGWAKIKNDYEGNEAGYIFKVLQSKQEELEENDGKDEFAKLVEEAD